MQHDTDGLKLFGVAAGRYSEAGIKREKVMRPRRLGWWHTVLRSLAGRVWGTFSRLGNHLAGMIPRNQPFYSA